MDGIADMVKGFVHTYHSVSDEQKSMFGSGTQEVFRKCPKCGGDVVKGKFGACCKNKCGMNVSQLKAAYLQVVRNKGAAGVDGIIVEELGDYLSENGENIKV